MIQFKDMLFFFFLDQFVHILGIQIILSIL